jgi:pantoate--beta-alanine ligase
MAEDLNLPLKVVGVSTVREDDGLALSSRNAYLGDDERQRAPVLYRTLISLAGRLRDGNFDYTALEEAGRELLQQGGLQPDYLAIRRSEDLQPPRGGERNLVLLAAAHLGRARLIDNVLIKL